MLKNLAKSPLTRPNNFMMIPQIAPFGYPTNVDPTKCTLITSFTSEREQWMRAKCINIHDQRSRVYELTSEYDARRALIRNFFMLLESYQVILKRKVSTRMGCRADLTHGDCCSAPT